MHILAETRVAVPVYFRSSKVAAPGIYEARVATSMPSVVSVLYFFGTSSLPSTSFEIRTRYKPGLHPERLFVLVRHVFECHRHCSIARVISQACRGMNHIARARFLMLRVGSGRRQVFRFPPAGRNSWRVPLLQYGKNVYTTLGLAIPMRNLKLNRIAQHQKARFGVTSLLARSACRSSCSDSVFRQ